MYLSRLILNPRNRAVQRDLADCQQLHRTVMGAFPQAAGSAARAEMGVLYRLDSDRNRGTLALLVQSGVEPNWSSLPAGYVREGTAGISCKKVDEHYGQLRAGMVLAFRLRANPTRKIDTRSGPLGERRNGRRVELRGDEAQINWLLRKGQQYGFRVLAVRASAGNQLGLSGAGRLLGQRAVNGAAGQKVRVTLESVLFEGRLMITDDGKFHQALEMGIGPGKAYGLGLLSVAPPGR